MRHKGQRRDRRPADPPPHLHLSRRERQILDILYRLGRASAAEIHAELPDPPGYSAVRALLRFLEEKGAVRHETNGKRYLYAPTVPRETARRSALLHLLRTFFEGSVEKAVASLIDLEERKLTDEDLERLSRRIEEARRSERAAQAGDAKKGGKKP